MSAVGRRIGNYRLCSLVGEGGMGEVYLAERESEFQKRVAIKLIRAGMAGSDTVRRFLIERQTLAVLNHPQIVRLIDGGATEDGLPYKVWRMHSCMPCRDSSRHLVCDGEGVDTAR
jgi:serine/threonine protein kinase